MNRRCSLLLVTCLAGSLVPGCGWLAPDTVPYTGRKRPHLQYTEQEMAHLGAESYREVLKESKVVRGTAAASHPGSPSTGTPVAPSTWSRATSSVTS